MKGWGHGLNGRMAAKEVQGLSSNHSSTKKNKGKIIPFFKNCHFI
jgi:hypothetical protein